MGPETSQAGAAIRLDERPLDDDAVTSARREFKFVLEHADSGKIRSILETHCNRILHAGPVSTVHSIYFDDPRLQDCADSIAGDPLRLKARLRWYDEDFPTGTMYFERKQRRYNMVKKTRIALRADRPLDETPYAQLHRELCSMLPEPCATALAVRPLATTLIEYKREHFRAPTGPTRITLDYSMKAYAQIGLLKPAKRFGAPLGDRIVIEVKAPPGAERDARRLLRPLRPVLGKCSKYVASCLQLGLFSGAMAIYE